MTPQNLEGRSIRQSELRIGRILSDIELTDLESRGLEYQGRSSGNGRVLVYAAIGETHLISEKVVGERYQIISNGR